MIQQSEPVDQVAEFCSSNTPAVPERPTPLHVQVCANLQDLESSEELAQKLNSLFPEDQIYRQVSPAFSVLPGSHSLPRALD